MRLGGFNWEDLDMSKWRSKNKREYLEEARGLGSTHIYDVRGMYARNARELHRATSTWQIMINNTNWKSMKQHQLVVLNLFETNYLRMGEPPLTSLDI